MTQPEILWQPSQEFIENSNLKAYEKWLNDKRYLTFENYADLWQWSVDHIEEFWKSLWEYFEIISHSPYQSVLSSHEMPGAKWFEGSTLNYAEHIFRNKSDDRPALIFHSEAKQNVEISWNELEQKVIAVKNYLVSCGIGQGDCVVGYLPNIPEAIIAFYAVNSLGAVWSCCSPDFGTSTVIDRFSQIEPRLFITVDGYQYAGKQYSRVKEIAEVISAIPSIEQTIFIPDCDETNIPKMENITLWNDIHEKPTSEEKLTFTAVPFDHPIWVLYSSGTTGKPKAITHSHGGVLLEHLKYMAFHNDVHPGENFFWFTTTGWMMWNFLQASLLMGATAVLFDGSPGYPNLATLWKLIESTPIHHFGTSAPFLTACMKRSVEPGKDFDLSQLRSIGSTGAPLPPETFEWIYQSVSENVWLCSMSGGTDVCTAFVGGTPYEPVHKGQIQCRTLGCKLLAYDDDGNPITESLGEMVIEKPMPSMPVYFWNDQNNERYLSSYFEKFPGKWCHGDWIDIAKNGSLSIHGRSDATLNRKGIRVGTSEIYSALDNIAAVKDSLVLNLEKPDGSDVMPIFVVVNEGSEMNDELKSAINNALKIQCSPRHIPDVILEVPDLPYTLSGKKMEVPVKKILMGMEGGKSMNKDAVRNPGSIDYFIQMAYEFREEYFG